MEHRVRLEFEATARAVEEFGARSAAGLLAFSGETVRRLRVGGKVMTFGNGGSAADAQHLAAELINRFQRDRPPMAAIALTTDSSVLTSVSNDIGFERVFERQVRGLVRAGDVLIGLSTSGSNANVLAVLRAGRETGCLCVGLTGGVAATMEAVCGYVFAAPGGSAARVQECHIVWIHAYCGPVEEAMFREEPV